MNPVRPVTLCLAYYENPAMLELQLANLASMPSDLSPHIFLTVVDDGSPRKPAAAVFSDRRNAWPGVVERSTLLRHTVDIPWNQDAARNLAVGHARSPWVILTDMDHLPTPDLFRAIMTGDLDDRFAYRPARWRIPGPGAEAQPYKPHPNSYVMTSALYWKAGGFDERYRGIYGTDGQFRRRLDAVSYVRDMKESLVLYPREVVADASTVGLERKSDANHAAKQAMDSKIKASGDPAPKRGLTAWERIL